MFSKFLHAAALLFPRQVTCPRCGLLQGLAAALYLCQAAACPSLIVSKQFASVHRHLMDVKHISCRAQVHGVGVPYWFLPDEGGTMTPATYEEMADTSDIYLKVQSLKGYCSDLRVNQLLVGSLHSSNVESKAPAAWQPSCFPVPSAASSSTCASAAHHSRGFCPSWSCRVDTVLTQA